MEVVLVSVPEAAKALSIGLTKTWALIGRGELKTRRLGGRTLVVASSIRELADGEQKPQ